MNSISLLKTSSIVRKCFVYVTWHHVAAFGPVDSLNEYAVTQPGWRVKFLNMPLLRCVTGTVCTFQCLGRSHPRNTPPDEHSSMPEWSCVGAIRSTYQSMQLITANHTNVLAYFRLRCWWSQWPFEILKGEYLTKPSIQLCGNVSQTQAEVVEYGESPMSRIGEDVA